MIFLPKRLSVEITTKCNLKCEICPKQSPNYHEPERDMDFEVYKNLLPLFPYLSSIVLNGIGEPLLHEEAERFVALAREKMPENSSIGFQTNALLLNEKRLSSLLQAGLNRICVSMDSLIPIKGLHEPEIGKKALEIIYKAKKDGHKGLKSGIEIVITKYNIHQILPTLIEASKYGIDFVILSHLIPYSQEASKLVCYETSNEEAVRIFKKWLNRLLKKGYTVEDWLELMKKKALPEFYPQDSEPLKIFNSMYEEALEKGITLHFSNLINRDEALINETKRILEEVEILAKKLNLSIQVPRTSPLPHRKCEFFEEKCMFIGVDGEVSPCYFLWHDFTCYIGGLRKAVKRWSFGNIKEKNPLEIYNSTPYRSFGDSVIKYDFPYCYDCNFALCDLMELEDFLYDCFTNPIPCGACLWCGGLFYCMI